MGEVQINGLTIRKALPEDLPEMMPVYTAAREYMAASGNPDQWAKGFPGQDIILNEINRGVSYIILKENGIVAAFSLVPGEDPTYSRFYGGGEWLNDEPYCTIHRLASSGKVRGVFDAVLSFALMFTDNVRADTHEDNLTMQHLFLSRGFRYTGIIHLLNGSPRKAYHFKR